MIEDQLGSSGAASGHHLFEQSGNQLETHSVSPPVLSPVRGLQEVASCSVHAVPTLSAASSIKLTRV